MWHRGFHPVWAVLLLMCVVLSAPVAYSGSPQTKPLPEDLKLSPAAVLRSRAMAAYARAVYQLQHEAAAGTDAASVAEQLSVFFPALITDAEPLPSDSHSRSPGGPLFGPFRVGAAGSPPILTPAERDLFSACLDDPACKNYLELLVTSLEAHGGARMAVRQLWMLWTLRPEAPLVTMALADLLAQSNDFSGAIRIDQWGLDAGGWTDVGLVRELSGRLWEAGRTDESLAVLRTALRKPAMQKRPEVYAWLMERLILTRTLPQYDGSWWRTRSLLSEAKAAAAKAVTWHELATSATTLTAGDLAELSRQIGVTLEMPSAAFRLLVSARRLAPADAAWFDLAEADIRICTGQRREAAAILGRVEHQLAAVGRRADDSAGSGQRPGREGQDEAVDLFRCNLRLAQLAVGFPDVKTAISSCRRALALQPKNDRLRIFYASMLLAAGQGRSAEAVVLRVRRPALVKEKYVLLALIARSEKKLAAACELFARAEKIWQLEDLGAANADSTDAAGDGEAGTTFVPVVFYTDYSLACEEAGQIELAIRKAKQAFACAPDAAMVQNTLAYLLAEHNRELELAELLARKALETEPQNAAYLDTLAWVLHRRGRQPEALDAIRRAIRHATDAELKDGVLWEHAGDIAAAAGHGGEARKWWGLALKADAAKNAVIRAKLDQLPAR